MLSRLFRSVFLREDLQPGTAFSEFLEFIPRPIFGKSYKNFFEQIQPRIVLRIVEAI